MNADSHSESAKQGDRQAWQFSVRELLILTVATSLILALGVVSRGSTHFHAFSSPWALAALVPVAAVLAIGRFQLASARALAIASPILFVASLTTPAIALNVLSSPSVVWGWQALYFSLLILLDRPWAFVEQFTSRVLSNDTFGALAYLLGDVANIFFVVGVVAILLSINKPGGSYDLPAGSRFGRDIHHTGANCACTDDRPGSNLSGLRALGSQLRRACLRGSTGKASILARARELLSKKSARAAILAIVQGASPCRMLSLRKMKVSKKQSTKPSMASTCIRSCAPSAWP